MPNSLETPDRAVEMLFVIESPRVVLFGNLLSDEECDLLVSLSRDKLQRSSVVNASTGAYDIHPHRTSSGTYFKRGENELLQRIERRIAELVDCPVEQGEPIQVLHYEPGGEYKPHYDYFDPAHPGQSRGACAGRTTHCNVDHVFERRDARRIDCVSARSDSTCCRARAMRFTSPTAMTPAHSTCARCMAAARLKSGEKWIATKWFRQQPYVGSGA